MISSHKEIVTNDWIKWMLKNLFVTGDHFLIDQTEYVVTNHHTDLPYTKENIVSREFANTYVGLWVRPV